jgi:hypothetical protein
MSEPRSPRLTDWNILRMFASEMQNVWAFPDYKQQRANVGAGFARPKIVTSFHQKGQTHRSAPTTNKQNGGSL